MTSLTRVRLLEKPLKLMMNVGDARRNDEEIETRCRNDAQRSRKRSREPPASVGEMGEMKS